MLLRVCTLSDLGYLSNRCHKWLNGNGSRNLDTRLQFNLPGHGYKVVCETLYFALWQALWIAYDEEEEKVQEIVNTNAVVDNSIFLPTLLLSALWVIHMKFRRMWCVLWSSHVEIPIDGSEPPAITQMKRNAKLGSQLTYKLISGLV